MNTLFSYPVDRNLICAVKLLKVSQLYAHVVTLAERGLENVL